MDLKQIVALINKHKVGWIQQGPAVEQRALEELGKHLNGNWTQALSILYYALLREPNITDVSNYTEDHSAIMAELSELKKEKVEVKQKAEAMTEKSLKKQLVKGDKIAYHDNVTKDQVIALRKKGYTYLRIAAELGTSKSTIWRRMKE